jgi:Na+:H+ antiporter, NhaA family
MTNQAEESDSASPFQEFFRTEAAAGALLVLCACVALGAANSRWAAAYHGLWATPIVIGGAGHLLSLSLHQWINDGLMTVFAFLHT